MPEKIIFCSFAVKSCIRGFNLRYTERKGGFGGLGGRAYIRGRIMTRVVSPGGRSARGMKREPGASPGQIHCREFQVNEPGELCPLPHNGAGRRPGEETSRKTCHVARLFHVQGEGEREHRAGRGDLSLSFFCLDQRLQWREVGCTRGGDCLHVLHYKMRT